MKLFLDGWKRHYGDMVEWHPLSTLDGLKRVDVDNMTIETGLDSFKADAACVVPAMSGGRIAALAGLSDGNGWAPIEPATMRSQRDPNIWVIGDSSIAAAMPKSGFAANSQAKSCAMAVRHSLLGSRKFPARYANTCWSFLAIDDGIKVGATYKPGAGRIEPVSKIISKVGESAEVRQRTYAEFFGWYKSITHDMFG
jgi:NADPH-dependent 2,4-dienoyl-CoA reductase/sulfur reductase-like enzyme